MKSRALWTVLALAALAGVAVLWLRRAPEAAPAAVQSAPSPSPPMATTPAAVTPTAAAPTVPASSSGAVAPPTASPMASPVLAPAIATAPDAPAVGGAAPVASSPGRRPPVVAIQDGKTINFSSGQPVIIDADKENAALEKALKEMDEATKGITFPARPAAEEKK